MNRTRLFLGVALGALVAAPMAASAQTDFSAERITVTVQKREETAFEVPVTLTAYDEETLELLNIEAFDQLSDFVPGLVVQLQSPNNPAFVIRGITSDNGSFQEPPRVSVFYNGVDVSRSRGSAFELFDIERVEVVKGPQATLFGTAAAIGAVSVIPNAPEQEFGGSIYGGYGSYNYTLLGGHVTGGTDLFQARLAGQFRQLDGTVTNLAGQPGSSAFGSQDDLNGVDTIAGRASLRFTPAENFTADFVATYEQNSGPGTAFISGTLPTSNGPADPFGAAELGGALGQPSLLQLTGLGLMGPEFAPVTDEQLASFLGSDELGLDRQVLDYNLTVNWDINEAFSLTGIAAYREFDSVEVFDADGAAVPLLEIGEDTEGEQTSLELRVNFDNGGRFRGFAGVNYFTEEGFQRAPFAIDETIFLLCLDPSAGGLAGCVNPNGSFNRININATQPNPMAPGFDGVVPAALAPGLYYPSEFTNTGEFDTLSLFADLTVDITPRLQATAGIRYVDEEGTTGIATSFPDSTLTLLGALAVNPAQPVFSPALPGSSNTNGQFVFEDVEDDDFLPRFNLRYVVSEDLNVYGTVSKGRRRPIVSIAQDSTQPDNPLTPNDFLAPATQQVAEEIIWNYEIGFKSEFLNNRVRLEGALFYQDYEDFRVTFSDASAGGGIVLVSESAGEARNIGIEFEGQASLSDALTLFATYAYIDAQIDDDATNGDLAGNRFRLTPENSASLALDYRRPLLNTGLEGFGTVSYSYRSDVFFENDNDPLFTEDAVSLVNLSLGVQDLEDGWTISAFGRNITNEDYLIDAGNTGATFGTGTFIPGLPSIWGIELRSEF